MRREVRSFWYPTWLAQPAALVEGSKLIDAPPHRLTFDDVAPEAANRDLVVLHTSTPSFASDVKTVEALKARNPESEDRHDRREGRGRTGGEPEGLGGDRLRRAQRVRFHHQGSRRGSRPRPCHGALLAQRADGTIVHNEDRAILENMDDLPFVTPVYKRDLVIENYFGGYLKHPYMSFYTGRGCKSRCTFCLWPQTIGGHRYRTRSVGHVIDELKWAQKAFPQVKEFFFDDDTLTDNLPRVEALAREIGKLGIDLVVQRQGQRPALDAEGHEGQRLAASAGRLRIRQSEDPAQHQEGHAGRRRAALHQGLPRARHRHPRHLHPRPAGRDQGNHRGNHPLRHRDQSAHDPDLARRALSRHVPLQAGDGKRLARG